MNTGSNQYCNLSCFSDQNRNRLLSLAKDRIYDKGEHLFWEGDLSDKLFLVKSGSVKLTKSTDEGKELVFYMYRTDDIFGQICPFYSTNHYFTATVIEECEIGIIEQEDIEIIMRKHHDFSIDFMRWVNMQHHLIQIKLCDLIMYGKAGALCSILIRLANTYGQEMEDGSILIPKKITHIDLSNLIGATRESVNRMTSDLRKRGVIEYKNGMIVIKELEYLHEVCHYEMCPKELCRI